jgi:hypothetical protein
MQRIGDLMDVALNNRQASNPFEPRRNKPSRVIYPPTGLTAATGIKAVKLSWTAADSDEHLRYEVEVRDVGRGTTSTKSSFTNNLTFYGRGGSYVAKVWSVGRNGRSSSPELIEFDIGVDVMQIEGAKLGTQERGVLVQDDILHLSGHNIFVWGAVVLDEFIAGESNEPVTFKLWRKLGDDATFVSDVDGEVTLVETIQLYPATEDATNLSDSALSGGSVIRFSGARLGSFGTSQSVMFSPIPVADDEKDKRYTYFLQATGREIETDEVSLSITIWAGAEGIGNSQPGNVYSRPGYVFPHYNHWHTWNTFNTTHEGENFWDSRWAVSQILDGYSIPANQWTLAFWWRPDAIYPAAQADFPNTYPGTMTVFGRDSLRPFDVPVYDAARNQIRWFFSTYQRNKITEWPGELEDQNWVHQSLFQVFPRLGADAGSDNPVNDPEGTEFDVRALVLDDDDGTSELMPWSTINPLANQNDGWYFTVFCYEGHVENNVNAKPMLRMWHNMGINTDPEDQFNTVHANFHKVGMRNVQIMAEGVRTYMYMSIASLLSTRRVLQDDKENMLYYFGCSGTQAHFEGIFLGGGVNVTAYAFQFHQAGMWNIALDEYDGYTSGLQGEGQAAINYLYNIGHGTEIDWRQDSEAEVQPDGSVFQAYPASENLCHLWQFGAIETPFYAYEALRDTGYHVFGGDLNFTTEIYPNQEETEETGSPLSPLYGNRSYGNTGGIWDVRSPEGTNGTTQSDLCYPGQNLVHP